MTDDSVPISYAYVRFVDDKLLKIVHIRDIQAFCPKHDKDFVKTKLYNVQWSYSDEDDPSYYKAQIILLGGILIFNNIFILHY